MAGLGAAGVGSAAAAAALAALILLLIVFVGTNLLGVIFYYVAKRKNIAWLQYLSGCLLYVPITLLFVWAYIINKPKNLLFGLIILVECLYLFLIQRFYFHRKSIHISAAVCSCALIIYYIWKSSQPSPESFIYEVKNEKGDWTKNEAYQKNNFVFIETQPRPNELEKAYWGQIKFIGNKALLLKCYFEDQYVPNKKQNEYGFGIPYDMKLRDITFSRIKNIKEWKKGQTPHIPNVIEWQIREILSAFLKSGDWISSETELFEKFAPPTDCTVPKSLYEDLPNESSTNPQQNP